MTNEFNSHIISLIYEYNNNSPLFARVAYQEMESGNIDFAKNILDYGLQLYPKYSTAYFIYSLLMAKKGEKEEAINYAKKGNEFLNSYSTMGYYLTRIENITSGIEDSPATEPAKRPEREAFESVLQEFDTLFEDENPKPKTSTSTKKSSEEEFTSPKIISDTLANIHFSQGSYTQALDIYKQLLDKHPEKSEFYLAKIEELNRLIQDK